MCLCLQTGSQGLRGILRSKGNPIEKMNDLDVKPFLQEALITPAGRKVVDLEDPEVPAACITEGDCSGSRCCCLPCNKTRCEHVNDVLIKNLVSLSAAQLQGSCCNKNLNFQQQDLDLTCSGFGEIVPLSRLEHQSG